ncbi:Subtilase family protein [compost metagenome]
MSTTPAPRQTNGSLEPSPLRADLFGRASGTSMATPIVAGVAALLLQQRRNQHLSVNVAALRKAILDATVSMGLPVNVVGVGRVKLS